METFNSRRWMGLTPTIYAVLCFLLSACNSTDESFEETLNINEFQGKVNSEIISLSNGNVLILSDTTTYTVDVTNFDDVNIMMYNKSSDLFESINRTTNSFRAYGYDSQEPETDWKKYSLSKWKQYGVSTGIYIGRYVQVHKNLSIEPGTYAIPGDYSSEKAPQNVMGWDGKTDKIGFTATSKSDYISDGVTRIFIIYCDLSGTVYNKNIPADPSTFEWAYKLETKVDIWD